MYPNRKPWMTGEVRGLLKARNSAFRTGDRVLYGIERANLKRGIRKAKTVYRGKIEDHLSSHESRQVWQGVQHLTGYKPGNPSAVESSASLVEELNTFFARFEVTSEVGPIVLPESSSLLPIGNVARVEEEEVRQILKEINTRKAMGPDGVAGRVLRDCSEQLAETFMKIFNRSLAQATVPPCLKSSTIIPLPKKSNIDSLNDFRPVALTPVIMKCFEKLVRKRIMACLPAGLDPCQFAYKEKRSTEDAVATALHAVLTHLEKQGNYARLLFVDFSSAFNTILPHRLVPKLLDLGLPLCLCRWILDFLSDRSQRVRMGSHVSADLSINTGTPQGCVLSPLLYTLYTYDCVPNYPSNKIIKFADDTTVVGLISAGEGESAYRKEVEMLTEWCRENNLFLNLKKTKEIIVDFRKRKLNTQPIIIEGSCVEQVSVFRFLGMELRDDLTWGANTKDLMKRAQQRLYFLRILRKNHLSKDLLLAFYHCTIESVLTYGLCVWFGSCTARERTMLSRVIKTAERIIGCTLPTLDQTYASRSYKKAVEIVQDLTHPGNDLFQLLPSRRRYRVIKTRTSRLRNSFYPRAVLALNAAKCSF